MKKTKRVIKAFVALHPYHADLFCTDSGKLRIQKYDETAPDTMSDEDAVHQVRLQALRGSGEAAALLELHGMDVHKDAEEIEMLARRWEKLGVDIYCPEDPDFPPEDANPLKWNDEQLAQVIAQQCYFINEHYDDELRSDNAQGFELVLEGVSYAVSMLLTNNTVEGQKRGAHSDVCLEWLKRIPYDADYYKIIAHARKMVGNYGGSITKLPVPPVIRPQGDYVIVHRIANEGDAIELPNGHYVVLGITKDTLHVGLAAEKDEIEAWVASIDSSGVKVMPNSGGCVGLVHGLDAGDKLGG